MNEATEFLGWCTVINSGFLIFATVFITLFRNFALNLHSKILDVSPDELPRLYFQYLANYKLAIIMLNLTPYLALKIMG